MRCLGKSLVSILPVHLTLLAVDVVDVFKNLRRGIAQGSALFDL